VEAANITAKKDRTELLNRAGKISKQGKAIKNRLERHKLDEVEKPKSRLPLKLKFLDAGQSGVKVFSLNEIRKTIGSKNLGPINFNVQYGNRVLILGDNGAGKTTLLRMLIGELGVDSGEIERGTGLRIGYLPQIVNEDHANTVLSFFKKHVPDKNQSNGRKILNRFNITTEDVGKTLGELSPGLHSRLVLAIMMSNKPNCLILDEPSNHLDLEVLGKLEEALAVYKGTLVVVSHDRRFIKKINPTKIYNLNNEGILKEVKNID